MDYTAVAIFSGPEVADELLLWVKTRIRQFAHTIRSYGNGALLVRLPVIRLFPSFSQVLPVCFGYTTDGRDRGRPIVTQFRVRFQCRRRYAREDHANAQTHT